jgi:hypothetical protein
MRWRVYYGDGSTFSDEDGTIEMTPALNVQAIVQSDPDPHGTGRHVIHGGGQRPNRVPIDYYWWDPGRGMWVGGDLFGLWDYLTRPGWRKVLFGRTIPDQDYQAIIVRAGDDPDFPYGGGGAS